MKALLALLFVIGSLAHAKRIELSQAEREFENSWFSDYIDAGFRGTIVTPLEDSHFGGLSSSRVFKFSYWPPMPRNQLNFPMPLKAYARLLQARYLYNFVLAFSTGEHGGFQGAVVSAQQLGEDGPRYLIVTPTTDEATAAHEIQHIKDARLNWIWEAEARKVSKKLTEDQVGALFNATSELRAWAVHTPLSTHPFESEYASYFKHHLKPFLDVLNELNREEIQAAVTYLDETTDDFIGDRFREHALERVRKYVARIDFTCEAKMLRGPGDVRLVSPASRQGIQDFSIADPAFPFEHINRESLISRFFSGRSDGLIPACGEEFLLART